VQIEYGSQSDQGRSRTSNEDSFKASGAKSIFVVADGMGGHAAGEVASQIAVSTVEDLMGRPEDAEDGADEVLLDAAQGANARVYASQNDNPELAGMGSTLTALTFRDGQYFIAHVGDSRAYRLRDGALEQLTRDHSLVWQLYESGVLRKEDLSSHPQKNLITRSVGPHPRIEIDLERGDVREGDIFLLCSDGLTDVVSDLRLHAVLTDPNRTPQQMCDTLVQLANDAGGPDNITAVIVRVVSSPSP
jgi:protein phosphatase